MIDNVRRERSRVKLTKNLRNSKAHANGGVSEGHDGCKSREPPNLVKAGDLRENNLDRPKGHHVSVACHVARSLVTPSMEAACPVDGPAS